MPASYEMNSVDGAGMITALLKFAGLSGVIRHVMYDVSDQVTTNPALATYERLIFTRQSTITGVSADVFYIEFSRDTTIPEIWMGAPGGRVGWKDNTGKSWVKDAIIRAGGFHWGLFATGGTTHFAIIQATRYLGQDIGNALWAARTALGFDGGYSNVPTVPTVALGCHLLRELAVIQDSKSGDSWYPASRTRLSGSGQIRANGPSTCGMISWYSVTSNVLTLRFAKDDGNHIVTAGDVVRLTGFNDTTLNGVYTITSDDGNNCSMALVHADIGITVPTDQAGRVELVTRLTATRSRSSNVATVTLSAPHYLCTGQWVTITGLGGAYDGTFRVTAVNSQTSFSYASTGSNESATADTDGTVTSLGVLELGSDTGIVRLAHINPITGAEEPCTLAGSIIRPTALAADVNDYAPGRARTYVLTTTGGSRAITGLVAGWDGEERFLFNNNASGGNNVTLSNASGSSAAANRFSLPGATTLTIAPQTTQRIWYDGTAALWKA